MNVLFMMNPLSNCGVCRIGVEGEVVMRWCEVNVK
jgi:hypothetical protein